MVRNGGGASRRAVIGNAAAVSVGAGAALGAVSVTADEASASVGGLDAEDGEPTEVDVDLSVGVNSRVGGRSPRMHFPVRHGRDSTARDDGSGNR